MSKNFCKHLRTKSMFVGSTPEEAFAEKEGEHITPCHFWCNLTQTVTGADDRLVHKSSCNESRQCFEG